MLGSKGRALFGFLMVAIFCSVFVFRLEFDWSMNWIRPSTPTTTSTTTSAASSTTSSTIGGKEEEEAPCSTQSPYISGFYSLKSFCSPSRELPTDDDYDKWPSGNPFSKLHTVTYPHDVILAESEGRKPRACVSYGAVVPPSGMAPPFDEMEPPYRFSVAQLKNATDPTYPVPKIDFGTTEVFYWYPNGTVRHNLKFADLMQSWLPFVMTIDNAAVYRGIPYDPHCAYKFEPGACAYQGELNSAEPGYKPSHILDRVFNMVDMWEHGYHCVTESLPRIGPALELLRKDEGILINTPNDNQAREYLQLVGIDPKRIISHSHYYARRLYWPLRMGCGRQHANRGVAQTWRHHLRVAIGVETNKDTTKEGESQDFCPIDQASHSQGGQKKFDKRPILFMNRKDAPNRRYLANHDAVLAKLRAKHPNETFVEFFGASHGPASEQLKMFASAKIVMGPHGNGFSNLFACTPGIKIFEFMQLTYDNRCFEQLTSALGHDYHKIYCENYEQGMMCNEDVMLEVVDIMINGKSEEFRQRVEQEEAQVEELKKNR